jgi:hypothetical protein
VFHDSADLCQNAAIAGSTENWNITGPQPSIFSAGPQADRVFPPCAWRIANFLSILEFAMDRSTDLERLLCHDLGVLDPLLRRFSVSRRRALS